MKKEPIYERHDIENTPFSIITEVNSQKHRIAIGNNLMCEKAFDSMNEATMYVNEKPWELILNTTALIATNIINQLNTKEND